MILGKRASNPLFFVLIFAIKIGIILPNPFILLHFEMIKTKKSHKRQRTSYFVKPQSDEEKF